METKAKVKPSVGVPPVARRTSDFRSVYANNVSIRASNWDFRLIFGELLSDAAPSVVDEHVGVTMSPQHAKAMMVALSSQIDRYEKAFGEIKWQPSA